jgi:hypothetical protein
MEGLKKGAWHWFVVPYEDRDNWWKNREEVTHLFIMVTLCHARD